MAQFRLVDFLRFVAAVVVMILHWYIFIFEKNWGSYALAFEGSPPLPVLLGPIYEHGRYAVQFFWMLSGFVFALVYGQTNVSLRTFAVRRFARLYPIAILSLALVAYLQAIAAFNGGVAAYFYPEGDLYHYVLNLLMISSWGLEEGKSFNGPFWSVSAEIPIYLLFWVLVRFLPMNAVICFGMAVVFFLMQDVMTSTHVDYCGLMFFMGATLFYLCKSIPPRVLVGVSCLAAFGALAVYVFVPVVQDIRTLVLFLAFAPPLALASALDRMWAESRSKVIEGMGAAGDLSYAVYLLHYPIILVIILTMQSFGVDRSVLAGNVWALLGYMCASVWLSHLCYKFYERPARAFLRRALDRDQSTQDGGLRVARA